MKIISQEDVDTAEEKAKESEHIKTELNDSESVFQNHESMLPSPKGLVLNELKKFRARYPRITKESLTVFTRELYAKFLNKDLPSKFPQRLSAEESEHILLTTQFDLKQEPLMESLEEQVEEQLEKLEDLDPDHTVERDGLELLEEVRLIITRNLRTNN